jgi:GntR family colanic acid and biofilm gene transcriptional regulator
MNDDGNGRRKRGRPQSLAPLLTPVDATLQEPVERQVYRSIRQGLMSGLIAPGATLTSRSLATQLKVSAQPVRDALKRLEADGIFEGRPQSGFYFLDPTAKEYLEILEIRERLEGLAARHAASNVGPPTIEQLRIINGRMAHQEIPQEYLAENYRFHFTIYVQSQRPALVAMIENLWMRIGPALHHHPHDYNREETLRKHDAIIAALERGNPDQSEAAVAHDLRSAADLIVQHLPQA